MGLVKRGKVWCMRFMYQGRQVRRSTGTRDRRLAEAIWGKVQSQLIEGRWFETNDEKPRTFNELLDRFLSEHATKQADPRHYRTYAVSLRAFFGGLMLQDITPKIIAEYKNNRYAAGLKPASINRELASLKKAFNLAVREWEWCRDNPVARVSMERENNRRDRWLTMEEEARLLKCCASWLHDLIIFALHTGMRMGEILELSWRGVDFNRRAVTVLRSKNGERFPSMRRSSRCYSKRTGCGLWRLISSSAVRPSRRWREAICADRFAWLSGRRRSQTFISTICDYLRHSLDSSRNRHLQGPATART